MGPARSWVVRRGWLVVVCAALGAGAAFGVSRVKAPSYSATAVVEVNPGPGATGPGSANEAVALAATYSGIIPQDAAIVRTLSGELGISADAVKRDVKVSLENGTSLLNLTFTDRDPRLVLQGATDVAQAILGPQPVTPTIPAGSVILVSFPSALVRSGPAHLKSVVLGGVLGLVLGLVLAVIWGRLDARVVSADGLRDELEFPVWDVVDLTPALTATLLRRWRGLAKDSLSQMAFVVTDARVEVAAPLVRALSAIDPSQASARTLRGRPDGSLAHPASPVEPSRQPIVVEVVAFAGAGLSLNATAIFDADLTTLVIPRGSRLRQVRACLRTLAELGVSPAWGLVVPRDRRRAFGLRSSVVPPLTPVDGMARPRSAPGARKVANEPAATAPPSLR